MTCFLHSKTLLDYICVLLKKKIPYCVHCGNPFDLICIDANFALSSWKHISIRGIIKVNSLTITVWVKLLLLLDLYKLCYVMLCSLTTVAYIGQWYQVKTKPVQGVDFLSWPRRSESLIIHIKFCYSLFCHDVEQYMYMFCFRVLFCCCRNSMKIVFVNREGTVCNSFVICKRM